MRIVPLLVAGLLIFSCGKNIDQVDLEAPARPKMLPKNADTALVETGIDAVSDGDYIYLEWQPNAEEDLKGYIVERKDPDSTRFLPVTPLLDKTVTSYTDNSELQTGRPFIYRLQAVDQNGNRSDYSFEHSYTLLEKVGISSFTTRGSDSLSVNCSFFGSYDNIYLTFRFYQGNRCVLAVDDARLIQPEHNPYHFNYRLLGLNLNGLAVRVDARYGHGQTSYHGSESAIKNLN